MLAQQVSVLGQLEKNECPSLLLSLGNVPTAPCSSGTTPNICQWIPVYNSGVFQTDVSVLSLRASEIMGMPFNSEVYISYCPLHFPDINPIASESDVMEAHLPSAGPLDCRAHCGFWTSCSSGRASMVLIFFPLVGYHSGVWILTKPHLCPSYPFQCGFFFISLVVYYLFC